jgi:ribonuclease HII
MADFALEAACAHIGSGTVAGIDEVGRGPLAGPVLAAAVVFTDRALPPTLARLDDSKRLDARTRTELAAALWAWPGARIGLGAASVHEIGLRNILGATHLAMARALVRLGVPVDVALVDGNRPPVLPCAVRSVVGGDARSLSIAAASVVAKVLRDRLMARLDPRWPGYGWANNAGYPTALHREALARLGRTPHHRPGFAPVEAACFAASARLDRGFRRPA